MENILKQYPVFILAAGVGSRLKELTVTKPKAMVPIAGVPMIDRLIRDLNRQGFFHFVINVHHHADLLEHHIRQAFHNLDISFSSERKTLLDTGGALIHAKHLLENNDFLVHNVDIMLPVELKTMLQCHKEKKALFTLAVSNRTSSRKLLFTPENHLCGWKNDSTGEIIKAKNYTENHIELSYSGVQWISKKYFDMEQQTGKFSIVLSWLNLCHLYPIVGFRHNQKGWFDMGTIEKIKEVEHYLQNNNN